MNINKSNNFNIWTIDFAVFKAETQNIYSQMRGFSAPFCHAVYKRKVNILGFKTD